jgi:hypothetical protein
MDARTVSVRGLARLMAGDGASERKIETERRRLNKYLNEGGHPEPERATQLERLLARPEGDLSALIPPRRRAELAARGAGRLEELAGRVVELEETQRTLLADLDDARTRLAQLESEGAKRQSAPRRQGRGQT